MHTSHCSDGLNTPTIANWCGCGRPKWFLNSPKALQWSMNQCRRVMMTLWSAADIPSLVGRGLESAPHITTQ